MLDLTKGSTELKGEKSSLGVSVDCSVGHQSREKEAIERFMLTLVKKDSAAIFMQQPKRTKNESCILVSGWSLSMGKQGREKPVRGKIASTVISYSLISAQPCTYSNFASYVNRHAEHGQAWFIIGRLKNRRRK